MLKTEPKQPISSTETTSTRSETPLPAQKSASPDAIDLRSKEFCRCLSSKELESIRESFVQTLPSYEGLTQYASSLKELVLPKAPSENSTAADTTKISTSGTSSTETQTQTQNTASIVSSISGFALSSLGASLVTTAVSLVESVAGLQKVLAENPQDKKALASAHSLIKDELKEYENLKKQLQTASPEEAKRLEANLTVIDQSLKELRKIIAESRRNICGANALAEQCGDDGFAAEVRTLGGAAEKKHERTEAKLEEIQARHAKLLADPSLTEEQRTELHKKFSAEMKQLAEAVARTHSEFADATEKSAEATGSSTIIREFKQILREGREAVAQSVATINETLAAWSRALDDNWRQGYSLDSYIQTNAETQARYAQQAELSQLRENQREAHERMINGISSESLSARSSIDQPSVTNQKFTPEGFKVLVWFNELKRKILHGVFDEEGLRRSKETKERERAKDLLEKAIGKPVPTNLKGEMSAAEQLSTLKGRPYR